MSTTAEFERGLAAFSQAFGAGDSQRFVGLFADDARVLLHQQPPLAGSAAIGEMFSELFATVDTSAFMIDYDVLDVHDDRAYVLATFRETLQPKDGGAAVEVDGRLVCFWQRQPDGAWKVSRVVTGRASPDRIAS